MRERALPPPSLLRVAFFPHPFTQFLLFSFIHFPRTAWTIWHAACGPCAFWSPPWGRWSPRGRTTCSLACLRACFPKSTKIMRMSRNLIIPTTFNTPTSKCRALARTRFEREKSRIFPTFCHFLGFWSSCEKYLRILEKCGECSRKFHVNRKYNNEKFAQKLIIFWFLPKLLEFMRNRMF